MPAKKNDTTKVTKAAAKFEELRKKAVETGFAADIKVSDEPYVIGKDFGFEEDIVIGKPTLESSLVAQKALRAGDVLDQAISLFGAEVTSKIVQKLDEQFDAAAGSQILTGFILDYFDHFWGQDSATVDGGFTS